MIAGIQAFNGTFLADLAATENRITRDNQEISSGLRVNQASDDPSAIAPIIDYQGQIDQLSQVQTNLSSAQTEATGADGALQQAATLLDQLISIAAQGASSTSSATSRATLGEQVQQIEQQLVAIANTTVQGRYIFGGDQPGVQPYTYSATSAEGVTQNSTPGNTTAITDSNGDQLIPRMTAADIFDARNADGTPATGNIFQAAFSLSTALAANDQTGVQNATASITAAVTQLGQATTFYGNTENWITQGQQSATDQSNNLQTELGNVKDADVASAATALSLDQVSLEAALSAHGTLDTRSLFSYLG